jgi:DNA-binding MarR family transcriptional regulator
MSGTDQESRHEIIKEDPNMATDVRSENLVLRLWFLMHRDVGLFRLCEDQAYGEKGLTMEQFTVLAAVKQIGPPAGIIEIAKWIGRSPNSISMIIDRMVKARLVKRTRDRIDRRVVNVTPTSKAENLFELAIPVGWKSISKVMSPLSQEDRQTFARLLETIRYEAFEYLNPGGDVEAMVTDDDKSHIKMAERLFHDVVLSDPQRKRQAGKQRL